MRLPARFRGSPNFLALVCFAILVLIFYFPEAIGQSIFFYGGFDNPLIYYPFRSILSNRLHTAALPLWEPSLGVGLPFLANPESASLYIPTLLMGLILPAPLLINGEHLLVVLGAGIGTYAFARSLSISPWASLAAAVAYAFGGPVIGRSETLFMAGAFTWLPLCFLLLERTVTHRSWSTVLPLGIVIALLMTAGSPQSGFFALVGGTFYFLTRVAQEIRSHGTAGDSPKRIVVSTKLAPLLRFAAGALLGAGLAAAQLLPALELIGETSRGSVDSSFNASAIAFTPAEFVTYLVPFSLHLIPTISRGPDVKTYLGVLPLVAALLAPLLVRIQVTRALAITYAFCALYALGDISPLWWILHGLPGFGAFKNPGYFMHIAGFAAAILAAFGLDALRVRPPGVVRPAVRYARMLFMIAGLLAVTLVVAQVAMSTSRVREAAMAYGQRFVGGGGRSELSREHYFDRLTMIYDRLSARVSLFSPYYGIAVATCALGGWLLMARANGKLGDHKFAALALTFIVADSLHFAYFLDTERSLPMTQFTARPDGLAFLDSDVSPFRVVSAYAPELRNTLFWTSRSELHQLNLDLMTPNLGAVWGVENSQAYHGFVMARELEHLLGTTGQSDAERVERLAANARVLGAVNVKYLIAPSNLPVPDWTSRYNGRVRIYENPEYLPRAYVVGDSRVLSAAEMVQYIQSAQFDPKQVVLLERETAVPAVPATYAPAEIVSAAPERIVVRARLNGQGFLVLSDRQYPGWRAEVDGRPSEILRANYLLRAVALPAGDHEVVFTYDSPVVRAGAAISAAALFASVVMLAVAALRRARSRA